MSFETYANRITLLRQLDCKNDKKIYPKKISGQKYKYDDDEHK